MSNIFKGLSALTGGASGALDAIDGGVLANGDIAEVVTSTGYYLFRLNATASASENSPLRINPDSNAGTKSWCLVHTSARIGALVILSSSESIPNAANTVIDWDSEVYDDVGFWEGVTNPSRISIPVGVTGVLFRVGLRYAADTSGVRSMTLLKNASFTYDGRPSRTSLAMSAGSTDYGFVSPLLVVTGGTDYFEINTYQSSGDALNIEALPATYFSVQAMAFG